MDDITSTLSKLLENPESLSAIKSMAQTMLPALSEDNKKEEEIFPADMSKMIKIVSKLKSGTQDDNNTRLLMSLRPYVSEQKQQKIDEAVKIMKLVSLLPLIKESGIF